MLMSCNYTFFPAFGTIGLTFSLFTRPTIYVINADEEMYWLIFYIRLWTETDMGYVKAIISGREQTGGQEKAENPLKFTSNT